MLRKILKLLPLPALLLTGALATAPAANASASGCTLAPLGASCIRVIGSGLHVDSVRAVRNKESADFICQYSARVFFHKPDGTTDTRDSQIVHNGACSPGDAWIDFNIGADYPNGTRVCTAFYENGDQQGGQPCETIHS
jgi:hypothetical protein